MIVTLVNLFLNDNSVKIFACFEQDKIVGIMVVSFKEQKKIEIIGIAVDVYARGNDPEKIKQYLKAEYRIEL